MEGKLREERYIKGTQSTVTQECSLSVRISNIVKMEFKKSFKTWRKAIGWSLLINLSIVVVTYGILLINSLFGQKQFNHNFETPLTPGSKDIIIPASWKIYLSNGALGGQITGLFISGHTSERFGYRKATIGAQVFLITAIFIPFFAPNIQTFLAGQIVCGIPWGMLQALAPSFSSDITPSVLRPHVLNWSNFSFVSGQFIGSIALQGFVQRSDEWAYRKSVSDVSKSGTLTCDPLGIPISLQWILPCLILIVMLYIPESPWWLVRQGRIDDAKTNILRLTTSTDDDRFDVDAYIRMVIETNTYEMNISVGTSYLDCFKRVDRRRTEISIMSYLVLILCGFSFTGFSTLFFIQAGLPQQKAFDLSTIQYALGMIGAICSLPLIGHVGRRTTYLLGVCFLFLLLLIMGLTSVITDLKAAGPRWAIASMMLPYTFSYNLSLGPVAYILVAEMPSTRLKAKTIVIATILYNIGSIVVNILTTYQLTEKPSGWGWSTKSALFWAGTCLSCAWWVYYRLPEAKGREPHEIDQLFESRTPARKFKNGQVCALQHTPTESTSSSTSIGRIEETVKSAC